jgi:uncharacterized membrane protein
MVHMVRDRNLYLGSILFALVGLVDSAYLTYAKLFHQQVICGGYQGCETVNTSPYSEIAGIPIALLGFGAYLAIFVLLILEQRGDFWSQNSPLLVFGISLAGVLYSAYLTYIELEVIHAVCFYCVISAVAITFLFLFSIMRLLLNPIETETI